MEVEVAMFQHVCLRCAVWPSGARASCAPRPVVPRWCARIPRASAPRPQPSATRPVPPGTRSWVPSYPLWTDMATFSGPRSTPFSAMFPANLGHVPRLSRPPAEAGAKCPMTSQPCLRPLSHVPSFLGHLSERPPQRPDLSHARLCVVIVHARPVLPAHMSCCTCAPCCARCPCETLYGTHTCDSLACVPKCSAYLVCPPNTLACPPCIFLQPTSLTVPPRKAWLCVGPCQLAHRPIRGRTCESPPMCALVFHPTRVHPLHTRSCMLGITPAMRSLVAHKCCHAFPQGMVVFRAVPVCTRSYPSLRGSYR
ncbi:hypothetical protein PanWU01x14_155770 [Parasponia andersonii]|uniref:Uncharacterized protein n=1 Tax=Parasponia andersonii TaxID=3476 RepID=A0A2P5CG87_PARAD|nr:hypothetical protein PanWU01x14_155770 [Parasponia andersonii]